MWLYFYLLFTFVCLTLSLFFNQSQLEHLNNLNCIPWTVCPLYGPCRVPLIEKQSVNKVSLHLLLSHLQILSFYQAFIHTVHVNLFLSLFLSCYLSCSISLPLSLSCFISQSLSLSSTFSCFLSPFFSRFIYMHYIYIERDRQTGRQTDRHRETERQRETQRERERERKHINI